MKVLPILAILVAMICLTLPGCQTHEDQTETEQHTVVTTSPKILDVVITQQYVCQIHSKRNIKVRALQAGYLEPIPVKEGQEVKQGTVMFSVIPVLYKAKLDAELAEAKLAELELKNTERLAKDNVVSKNEVALYQAKLARAQAKAELAKAELKFTEVVAPFDGIIDRLHEMHGSLIKEGDILTTLSDNSEMWVYFNVPEARYLEYMSGAAMDKDGQKVELQLANGTKFPYPASALRVEAQFNNENGNIPFRADFPNPNRLLRHGMTGNVLIHRVLHNVLVIPQRATFEILDKRYVYVVGSDGVVHQREVTVQNELQDIFVIAKYSEDKEHKGHSTGLRPDDRFVFEGVRQVHDGDEKECEYRPPEQILAHQNYHAE